VIRVLLADDHGLVREGLRGILAKGADIEVAAEAANGDEVLALVRKHEFDLALLDLSMPGLSGLALIKRLKVERPKLRILVLSMHGEAQYAARALKAGASGYLTKDSAAAQLLGAIRKIAAGGVHIGEAAAASLVSSEKQAHRALSDREFDILRQLVDPAAVLVVIGGEIEHAVIIDVGLGHRTLVEHQRDARAEMDRRGAVQYAEKLSKRGIAYLVVDAHDLVARQLVAALRTAPFRNLSGLGPGAPTGEQHEDQPHQQTHRQGGHADLRHARHLHDCLP